MYSSASNCVGMIAVTTLLQPFAALRWKGKSRNDLKNEKQTDSYQFKLSF
jgi:hypothetical protein